MPNKKKQRGREEKQKRIEAQKETKKAAGEQHTQQKAEESRVKQELAIQREELQTSLRRAQLQGLFGTPAIDELTTDMARSSLSTTLSTATAAAAVSKFSSSSSTTTTPDGVMVCYHGSSADHFVAGSKYLQMVKSYVSLYKKIDDNGQRKDAILKFFCDTKNQRTILHDEFTNFVFALAVALYFKLPAKEKDPNPNLYGLQMKRATAMHELEIVLEMGLNIKYSCMLSEQEQSDNRLKLLRKIREKGTERGLITVLSSETKANNDCDCMATKKRETKDMEKMQRCSGCREQFSNGSLMKCECNVTHYCSNECQLEHWSFHKLFCKENKKVLAESRQYRRNGGDTSNNDDEKSTKK